MIPSRRSTEKVRRPNSTTACRSWLWYRYGLLAQSLFIFRLILTGIACLVFAVIVATFGILIFVIAASDGSGAGMVALIVLGIVAMVGFVILFSLIGSLTTQFVVPIMYARSTTCVAAWREWIDLFSSNAGRFIGYVLFNILIHICVGIITIVLVLVTCCVAGCLLAIPYLGTVLYLPVYVFVRAYSLYYLAQYGPEFDVFQASSPAGIPAESGGA